MKKNIMRVISAVIALSLILSMGACGILDKLREPIFGNEKLPLPPQKASDGRYLTVEDLMKDSDVEEMEEELETDTEEFCEDVSISFSGNQMSYTFVFRSDFADKVVEEYSEEEISATLFNEEKSREFVGMANVLASSVAADDLSVLIVYKTPDDTVLASQVFYPTNAKSSEPSLGADKTSDGKYATVSDYLADPEVKAELDKSIAEMFAEDDSMKVTLEASEHCLYYHFIFSDEAMAGVDEAALIDALEEGLEDPEMIETFEGIAKSIAEVVDGKMAAVDVVYSKSDGTILADRIYFPEGVM